MGAEGGTAALRRAQAIASGMRVSADHGLTTSAIQQVADGIGVSQPYVSEDAGPYREALELLGGQADHRDVEQRLRAAGWTPCGAGDWAIALRSPDGTAAARISPFDPTGPYSVALYRQAAHTRQVPELFAHQRLTGGGDLQVLEWLSPIPEDEAVAFHHAIATRAPAVADLVDVVRRVHEQARRELPWCGPLDHNPTNAMRTADGRLVVVDLFYADGPNLYATAATDPDLIVALIQEPERRFMTEIPLAASGPWEPGEQEAMRAALAAADARRASARHGTPSHHRPDLVDQGTEPLVDRGPVAG